MNQESEKKLRLITIEQLLELQLNKTPFTLVDTLPPETYEDGHIPGALNMPSDAVAQEADSSLDKQETIVTYCASYACESSTIAARQLIDLGYEHVFDYKAGKQGWKDAGFALEK